MKKLMQATLTAATLLLSAAASANWMYIDVGSNWYDDQDPANVSSNGDADSKTGLFDEFGFSQLLATSIYDFSDGSIFGSFFDTNDAAILAGLGLPASGPSLGGPNVNLVLPNCPAQCDIDALSPLIPPLLDNQDGEGFLLTWRLLVDYYFTGTLTAAGPQFTGGYIRFFFDDRTALNNDRVVIEATLTGSNLTPANLDLFFDITFAETGFLWIDDGSGNFKDAASGIATGNFARLILDTNVNPPIPDPNELLLVGTNAIRQSTLDGSITATIPEPATIAILGLGLLGMGAAGRRQRKASKAA
ncbi:PEP-CTERM sorting domain-containing protein [Arsukibacterium sp.]|uniref:PEP-CTERM sorting domain-containing protein n=1 Tax=Arsukibacterium sp. TaxID=1977258 RepID=UPI002FD9043A